MFWVFLLLILPAAEIYVIVLLTRYWGIWLTLGLMFGTALVGVILARHEGLRVLRRMQEQLAHGEPPTNSMVDSVLILMAGALLIVPGFITDVAGILLILPPSRAVVRFFVKRWVRAKMKEGRFVVQQGMTFGPIRQDPPPGAPPLEGEISEQ